MSDNLELEKDRARIYLWIQMIDDLPGADPKADERQRERLLSDLASLEANLNALAELSKVRNALRNLIT